ncbi:MAG: hypothetical protein Fur0024_2860 [Patescibacteria group bacterium]
MLRDLLRLHASFDFKILTSEIKTELQQLFKRFEIFKYGQPRYNRHVADVIFFLNCVLESIE